jgi:hypothetical protein
MATLDALLRKNSTSSTAHAGISSLFHTLTNPRSYVAGTFVLTAILSACSLQQQQPEPPIYRVECDNPEFLINIDIRKPIGYDFGKDRFGQDINNILRPHEMCNFEQVYYPDGSFKISNFRHHESPQGWNAWDHPIYPKP